MSFKAFFATGLAGLCLAAAPFTLSAQTLEDSAQNPSLFVPMVAACVDTPTAETCGKVRAVVTECGATLEDTLCNVLFDDASTVFATPVLQAQAQAQLATASEAIADITFDDVEHNDIAAVIEESRADAERSMLRGDENLMSHSGPPSVEDN